MTIPASTATKPMPYDSSAARPVAPLFGTRTGAAVTDVTLDPSGFWGHRQQINTTATLQHCLDWIKRLGWLENFDRVASGAPTTVRAGWMFSDSEVYKLLEAMAWELASRPDHDLELSYREVVHRVISAQDPDGYIGTAFGHPGLPDRYTDMAMGHELYNIGHLLQAAVARLRTHGDDELTEAARRAADHVCREFGVDGRQGLCGHPEIEVALAEFSRATGDQSYLAQARLFIDRRGRGILPVRPLLAADYFQDDVPVREAEVLRGHAVRALYLSAGAVDVAVDTNDDDLLGTLRAQWARTVERRTYITGGMGSRHQDEGFGSDFELPADRAYCETCAGVASVMFSWRLYLATGDVSYADLIERTLYNVVAVSPSADGKAFFYANPLHQREAGEEATDGVNMRAEGGTRAPWFDVSCCPTNVARTLASLPSYFAALEEDGGLAVLQYAEGEIRLGEFHVRIQTQYPSDGRVRFFIDQAPEREARLRLRIPGWASRARLAVAGEQQRKVSAGWADISRRFTPGTVVDLDLPIAPRVSHPDPRVDAVRGTVAVESGPLVLCLESPDLPDGVGIDDVRVRASASPLPYGDGAKIRAEVVTYATGDKRPPYGAPQLLRSNGDILIPLIPYFRWAGRGASTMRIFLPIAADVHNSSDIAD